MSLINTTSTSTKEMTTSPSSTKSNILYVVKRNGTEEIMRFDKISDRIIELSQNLEVDAALITMSVISSLKSGMTTSQIDILAAETAYCLSTYNPDYDELAGRMYVSNLHKQTLGSFEKTLGILASNVNIDGENVSLIDRDLHKFALKYMPQLEKEIDYRKDYTYSYFALKTLERSYLQKSSSPPVKIIERPQHMLMRVALGIHYPREEDYKESSLSPEKVEENSLTLVISTYLGLSLKKFTHATPTLFNSGTRFAQLSSCYLLNMDDDTDHILETVKRCGKISKYAGGLGINASSIRCKGSVIRTTNGPSDGLIPFIKLFDQLGKTINQGGKRNGSIAIYLEPWHGDVFEFLELRLNDGAPDEFRAKNMFLGLWIPDLFMKRVKEGGMWSLMCPDRVKGLVTNYGEEFEKIYLKAESEGKFIRQVPATDIWKKIIESQINCGLPYMMYKDHINRKSNHINIGVIRGSNLCAEILEYTDKDNVAVCNLASISLPYFCKGENTYDFKGLGEITELLVVNLGKIIKYGYSPLAESKRTNNLQRAIGIGIQGLQEVMYINRAPWDSEKAKMLNIQIAETIYYYAVNKSAEMAVNMGSYHYFEGSPISKGILQCDMWKVIPTTKYDWEGLRERCKKGIYNSLLIAYMPTAATAQILGNTESFECATSNMFSRKVLAGEFPVVNKYLYRDLNAIGKWDKNIVDQIITNNGSIQEIVGIDDNLKSLYRTVWEYKQKIFVDLAIQRGAFVCQTQSFNVYLARPTMSNLSQLHMYSYENKAKTGSYYIRSQPARDAAKLITGNVKTSVKSSESVSGGKVVCNDDICITCQ